MPLLFQGVTPPSGGMTATRVEVGASATRLVDYSNFTYDGNTLTVGTTLDRATAGTLTLGGTATTVAVAASSQLRLMNNNTPQLTQNNAAGTGTYTLAMVAADNNVYLGDSTTGAVVQGTTASVFGATGANVGTKTAAADGVFNEVINVVNGTNHAMEIYSSWTSTPYPTGGWHEVVEFDFYGVHTATFLGGLDFEDTNTLYNNSNVLGLFLGSGSRTGPTPDYDIGIGGGILHAYADPFFWAAKATVGAQLQSNVLTLNGRYWNGSASVDYPVAMTAFMDTAPSPSAHIGWSFNGTQVLNLNQAGTLYPQGAGTQALGGPSNHWGATYSDVVYATTVDAPSAGSMAIGTGNATNITLGKNGTFVSVGSGATATRALVVGPDLGFSAGVTQVAATISKGAATSVSLFIGPDTSTGMEVGYLTTGTGFFNMPGAIPYAFMQNGVPQAKIDASGHLLVSSVFDTIAAGTLNIATGTATTVNVGGAQTGAMTLKAGGAGGIALVGVSSSGTPGNYLLLTPVGNTSLTAATELSSVYYQSHTQEWLAGTVASQREWRIDAPTYTGHTATANFTIAATFAISGAPIASTNAAIASALALWVQGGTSRFDGTLQLGAGASLSGIAGSGGLSLGSMTGDTTLPTGAVSWAGALAKTLSLVGASTMTLTAGAASTWDSFDGTVKGATLDRTSAGAMTIAAATATTLTLGHAGCVLSLGHGAVTQGTSITTGVTLNASSGVITTVSSTLATATLATFTVTNSCVAAASVVQLTISYQGTISSSARPVVYLGAVSAGSFTVSIYNAGSSALSNTMKIHFVVT